MTPAQYKLYLAVLKLCQLFGTTYGTTWGGQRGTGGGVTGEPTIQALASETGYVLPTSMLRSAQAIPGIELFTDPYIYFAPVGNVQPDDIKTNGSSTAFLIKGAAVTSLGFPLWPADLYAPYPPDISAGLAGYATGFDWPFTYAD